MTTTARLMPVVAMLLVAFVDGNLSPGPASAQDNCLPVPNAPAPPGSHWYYRTDRVKQIKCWYLRTEGQAIQKPAAQERPEMDVATGPAATPSKTTPDHRPAQAVVPAPAERSMKGSITRSAQASLRATGSAGSADNPTKRSIQRNAQASPRANIDKVVWPDPPPPVGADKVAWPDPPSPATADNVVWPDPPSPTRGATPEVASQNPPAAASTPQEKTGQTQEAPPATSDIAKKAANDPGPNRHIAQPTAPTVTQNEMATSLLLALAAGLVIVGIIVRRIAKMAFARRRSVHPERRESAWPANVASERMIPMFMAQDRALTANLVDGDLLDNGARAALRKLLRVLEQQSA